MDPISHQKLMQEISKYISSEEKLVSFGIFKRIPSITFLLLTKLLAWVLTEDFYVGVTDHRLIILPLIKRIRGKALYGDVIYAEFDEVSFKEEYLNVTILSVKKTFKGQPLNLRFKYGYQSQGYDPFEFIAAVQQGKSAQDSG